MKDNIQPRCLRRRRILPHGPDINSQLRLIKHPRRHCHNHPGNIRHQIMPRKNRPNHRNILQYRNIHHRKRKALQCTRICLAPRQHYQHKHRSARSNQIQRHAAGIHRALHNQRKIPEHKGNRNAHKHSRYAPHPEILGKSTCHNPCQGTDKHRSLDRQVKDPGLRHHIRRQRRQHNRCGTGKHRLPEGRGNEKLHHAAAPPSSASACCRDSF